MEEPYIREVLSILLCKSNLGILNDPFLLLKQSFVHPYL